ncbi:hypothetical protein ABPG72_015451 [Tetrahymena utriculariae]
MAVSYAAIVKIRKEKPTIRETNNKRNQYQELFHQFFFDITETENIYTQYQNQQQNNRIMDKSNNKINLSHLAGTMKEKAKLLAFQQIRNNKDLFTQQQQEMEEIQTKIQQLFINRPTREFFSHQIESYEFFMEKIIRFISDEQNSINNIFPKEDNNKQFFIRLVYENPTINPIPVDFNNQVVTPDSCFADMKTYFTSVSCDGIKLEKIVLVKDKEGKISEQKFLILENKIPNQSILLFKIPTMVRSKWCSTTKQGFKSQLDSSDPGCFFICNGQDKTITPLERSPNNKIITYRNTKKGTVVSVINSVSFTSEYTNKNIIQVIYSNKVKIQAADGKDITEQFLYVKTSQFDNQNTMISMEKEKVQHKSKEDGDEEEDDQQQIEEEKVQITDSKDKPSVFLLLTLLGVCDDKQIIKLCSFNDPRVQLELSLIMQKYRSRSLQGQIKEPEKAKEFLQKLKSDKLQMKLLEQIMISDILPHCCDSKNISENYCSKSIFLGLMVYRTLCVYLKIVPEESRDSYLNKRVVGVGELLYQKFENIYKKNIIQNLRHEIFNQPQIVQFIQNYKGTVEKKDGSLEELRTIIQNNVVSKNNVTQEVESIIITGKWTAVLTGISKQLPNSSIPARLATLRMVSNAPIFRNQQHGNLETRHVNNNQIGFYCPVGSPDGPQCGIMKEIALSCDISMDYSNCRESIRLYMLAGMEKYQGMEYNYNFACKGLTKIFIMGKLQFLTFNPKLAVQYIRGGRFNGDIPRYVTYEIQGDWNEILIYGDSGRMIRPLLVLDWQQKNQIIKRHKEIYSALQKNEIDNWEQFLKRFNDCIEWVDIQEVSNKMVCPSPQQLSFNNHIRNQEQQPIIISKTTSNRFENVYQNFDLMELHPINVLGINPSTIPYAHCNYAPRNIFAFVQMKKGVQKPFSDIDLRQEIYQYLILGSSPLVQTQTTNLISTNKHFNGSNICVAVLMVNGFQQEDSITFSSRLARSNYLQCKQDIIEEKIIRQQTGSSEKIGRPGPLLGNEGLYEKLDDNGLIKEGSVVKRGDIIIGKVLIIGTGDQEQIVDKSIKFDYEEGVIMKVKQSMVDGQHKIVIKFIIPLIPQIGDKYAARCGQKGTIGTIMDENMMPYTDDGTPIDIIINPCSFSTRMTIGMNIEHYTSQLALMSGMFIDASMFCDVKDQLEKTYSGLLEKYQQWYSNPINSKFSDSEELQRNVLGQKKIYSAIDGKCIDYAQTGFVFYASQEQKAFSKLYAVGFGEAARNQMFQPREGGKNHGGSKLGEMEMAAFLSAGQANTIKTFAQQHSDGFQANICSDCGTYASRDSYQKKWYCKNCDGKSDIALTQIQYSSKILKDYLNSLGISIHYLPNKF